MKRMISLVACLMAVTLLNGCIAFSLGGGSKTETKRATVGQQLVDLKTARDAGALTEAEYQCQRAKILEQK